MKGGALWARGDASDIVTQEMVAQVYGLNAQIYPDPVAGTPNLSAIR